MFFFFVVCRKQTNPRMCCIRPCTLCVETAMSTWQKKTGAVCFTASPVDLECSLESKTFTRLTLISSISFRSTFIAAATAALRGINTSGAGDRVIFDRTVLTNTACRVMISTSVQSAMSDAVDGRYCPAGHWAGRASCRHRSHGIEQTRMQQLGHPLA